MYNLKLNNYHQKPKNSNIYTPPAVSQFIFELLKDKVKRGTIFDPCSGQGSLLKPWFENGYPIFGVDIEENEQGKHWNEETPNLVTDFLALTPEKITDYPEQTRNPALILCNPPFNGYKGKAAAEVWLDQIIKLFGKDIPIVLFAPYNFRLPWKSDSKRLSKFLSGEYPPIASLISLPTKGLWEGVIFHSEILIFNIKGLQPHYFFNPTNQIEQRTPI